MFFEAKLYSRYVGVFFILRPPFPLPSPSPPTFQCSPVPYSGFLGRSKHIKLLVQYTALHCNSLLFIAVQSSPVQCSAVKCSSVQHCVENSIIKLTCDPLYWICLPAFIWQTPPNSPGQSDTSWHLASVNKASSRQLEHSCVLVQCAGDLVVQALL